MSKFPKSFLFGLASSLCLLCVSSLITASQTAFLQRLFHSEMRLAFIESPLGKAFVKRTLALGSAHPFSGLNSGEEKEVFMIVMIVLIPVISIPNLIFRMV